MHILLTGATGFIGGHLLKALLAAGHTVSCAVRHLPADPPPGTHWHRADFSRDHRVEDWLPRLQGVDVVVNAVGILKETRGQTFDALHHRAPAALFDAALKAGVKRVVQVSALGADEAAATAYHRSKRAADGHLLALPLDAVVVQPSLVFGVDGESTGFFLTLATLPVLGLPAGGQQGVQPVHVDDLVAVLLRLVEQPEPLPRRRLAVVGPRPLTLADYLQTLRQGVGLRPALTLPVPAPLVAVTAAIGDHVSGMMLDRDGWSMLRRGNTADAADTTRCLGRPPRAAETFIPRDVARDLRRRGEWGWLRPALVVSVALVWFVTAMVSFGLYPVQESHALLRRTGVPPSLQPLALYGAAGLDLLLGVLTLWPLKRKAWVWLAQIGLITAYTLIITVRLPEFWLHPYGPILKNLPLLAVLLLLWADDRRR
jgi:uncharacterized protein YbjT (DUF2867 family)